jgi:5-methyltetrahydropteroyltriglutamate--homocysteine methyltransferase
MLRADHRFVVTHVGSLVRPPAMIPYLEKIRDKEPYDEAAFEKCLTESVAEAVRLQAEAGIDVVSDGEYGKSVNWAFYVHRRLSGLTWRPHIRRKRRKTRRSPSSAAAIARRSRSSMANTTPASSPMPAPLAGRSSLAQ